jgi:hypothetical protein
LKHRLSFYTIRISSEGGLVVWLGQEVKTGEDILSDKHFYQTKTKWADFI